jgi:predicted ATP-binding protein involved in virulence
MIKLIQIDGIEITFGKLTVLTGKNGSGKTHLLRKIDMTYNGLTLHNFNVVESGKKNNIIYCYHHNYDIVSLYNKYNDKLFNLICEYIVSFKHKYDHRCLSDGDLSIIGIVEKIHNNQRGDYCNVVLIDDIELHLHPSLHVDFLRLLIKNNPKCQFIISTHSPLILGEVNSSNVRVLNYKDDKLSYFIPNQSYGLKSSEILYELMCTIDQNDDIVTELSEIALIIDDGYYDDAINRLDKLEACLNGSTPETVYYRSLINCQL